MNIEKTKREVIDIISELQDEKLVAAVKKMLEEALPLNAPKSREPGWAKGTFTYISDDFDDFITR